MKNLIPCLKTNTILQLKEKVFNVKMKLLLKDLLLMSDDIEEFSLVGCQTCEKNLENLV